MSIAIVKNSLRNITSTTLLKHLHDVDNRMSGWLPSKHEVIQQMNVADTTTDKNKSFFCKAILFILKCHEISQRFCCQRTEFMICKWILEQNIAQIDFGFARANSHSAVTEAPGRNFLVIIICTTTLFVVLSQTNAADTDPAAKQRDLLELSHRAQCENFIACYFKYPKGALGTIKFGGNFCMPNFSNKTEM